LARVHPHPVSEHLLTVIIVSWNVRDLLMACLRSLQADLERAGLTADIWVVDNGSTDGTPEARRAGFPHRPPHRPAG
jgi:N-acetylglucosaminyl-diphospho-decaprenol L-rhamnosyltransferase